MCDTAAPARVASRNPAASRSNAATRAPSRASASTMLRPIPCAAPVTIARRCERSIFMAAASGRDWPRIARAVRPRCRVSATPALSIIGVATPASAPRDAMMAICASTSVLRLRTARSRHMPEWVFAVCRLNSAIAATERRAAASSAFGMKAAGSNPLKPSGCTPRAIATAMTSRPRLLKTWKCRFDARLSDMDSLVSAVANNMRAVAEFSPEIAPDVVRQDRIGLENRQQAMIFSAPCRGASSSISPTATVARFPNRMRPGSSQSAPKFTKQPIVRSLPISSAMMISFKPFCAERTVPSWRDAA